MCLQYIDIKQKKLKQFYHNPRVGGSSPSSATKSFQEIEQIYQSHLIYGGFRIHFNMFICQSVCDQCVTVNVWTMRLACSVS